MMHSKYTTFICITLITILIFSNFNLTQSSNKIKDETKNENDTCEANAKSKDTNRKQPRLPCSLYLSKSTIVDAQNKSLGLGLFAGTFIPKGYPIEPSDIVIQLIDFPSSHSNSSTMKSIHQWIDHYLHDGHLTGGQFEGENVLSSMPGIGMISNYYYDDNDNEKISYHNALPYRPDTNEADLARTNSPGAGAISHYYNMTYFASKDIYPGDEIFIMNQRNDDDDNDDNNIDDDNDDNNQRKKQNRAFIKTLPPGIGKRNIHWLQSNAICMDKIKSKRSKVKHVGRGAIATRHIAKNEIITTSPLLIIESKDMLQMRRVSQKNKKRIKKSQQLLLNYCFGHDNSTVLFFPYGPVVNFINHHPQSYNAKIQWSSYANDDLVITKNHSWPYQLSYSDLQALSSSSSSSSVSSSSSFPPLLIDFVATRDIKPKEEIYIDYGTTWQNAWDTHVQQWSSPPNAEAYAPAYVMDDVISKIRTVEEQQVHPYPENLITACFYKYTDYLNEQSKHKDRYIKNDNSQIHKQATTVQWKQTRGIFHYHYLRPCTIISRTDNVIMKQKNKQFNKDSKKPQTQSLYMVIVHNRANLPKDERIPKNMKLIVSHVPRHALRFADKLYTTDQNLQNAFRQPIGMPDEMFPTSWMNLNS